MLTFNTDGTEAMVYKPAGILAYIVKALSPNYTSS